MAQYHQIRVPLTFRLGTFFAQKYPPAHPPKLTPNALPTGLVQRVVRHRLSIFSLKYPPNYHGPPPKGQQKKPRAIRNELLWTLLFYSVLALNAALKGTKLVWFWVGKLNPSYFAIEATSAAKSSTFFSMPSPFSKRVNLTSLISPPSSFATSLMCCSTETLFSLTNACWSRQFSS